MKLETVPLVPRYYSWWVAPSPKADIHSGLENDPAEKNEEGVQYFCSEEVRQFAKAKSNTATNFGQS